MIIKLLPDFNELPGNLDAAGLALLKRVANTCADCEKPRKIVCTRCQAHLCGHCYQRNKTLCIACYLEYKKLA